MAKLTKWTWRLIEFIPADQAERANGYRALYWPEGEPEALTFGVALSPSREEPATFYGCNTPVTDLLWAVWKDFYNEGVVEGALWYRMDALSGLLVESNSPSAQIGQPFDWQMALDDAGLQTIGGELI